MLGVIPSGRQLTLIREQCIVPLIRVVNQPRLDAPLTHGHGKRIEGELLIGVPSHGPADHPPRLQIQEHGHIEPAGPRRNVSEIADPHPIQRGGHKALL
ncbi:MAG: hypothetical protein K0S79_280 [Nitrospira sp.]|jgi:hypothetical protein|nr:hypothetical protein [Nitrospira sp.]